MSTIFLNYSPPYCETGSPTEPRLVSTGFTSSCPFAVVDDVFNLGSGDAISQQTYLAESSSLLLYWNQYSFCFHLF